MLGITVTDAEALRKVLLNEIRECEAESVRRDEYGQRYTVDFVLSWHQEKAVVRSAWIIEHGSETPRLTSCYPL